MLTATGVLTGAGTADQAVPDDKKAAVLAAFTTRMPGQKLPFGITPTSEGARGSDLIIEGITEGVTIALMGSDSHELFARQRSIAVLVAAFGLAYVVGRLTHAAGRAAASARPRRRTSTPATWDCPTTGPTVVHFSAVWCGPCAGVRRVVDQVCADLPAVAHVEIDMDANPAAARRLSVLSLPTTFVFDADGRPRYRASRCAQGR